MHKERLCFGHRGNLKRERNKSRWLIALCSVVFSVFAAVAAPVQITKKTNPKIVELYQKLQDKRAEVSGIESKRVDALNENLNAMRENEQRIENRILGGTTTLATGMGAMQAATGLAETAADERALADMRAYLSTFVCEFGNGQNVEYGPGDVTLPGGNELIEYYNEYKTLAEDLRKTKVALGLAPGIESEEILERADTGLYDNVAIGKTSGMYASLARGILNPDGDDAAQIAADTQKSADKLKAGAIAAGAGVVGGIIGNYKINKDAPKESSKQINQEYDAQLSKINQEAAQIETELDAAIAENAAAVREYNAAVESARKNVDEIQRAPTDCQELFGQYITDVSKLELVENETDSVPDITLPEMDSDLLAKCVQCKNKDAMFNAETKTCECPAERPLEQNGKCIAKPADPEPVVVVPSVGDDGTDDIETKTEEETKPGADDPDICAIGLKHTAGFGIVAGETRVGDECKSAQVLQGKVFKRPKDGTCGCTAIVCEPRAGRAAMAVGGRCVCDADRGYKDDKGKCVCDTDKGYKLVNGQCVNQNTADATGKGAEQPATPAPQKEYKYYNCGNANKGKDNWDAQTKAAKPNATCEWVGGAFSRRNVTPMEADGLMKEWALEKYNDTIICDDKSHRTSAEIQAFGDNWRNCVSTGPKEKYYEFAFFSLSDGNGGFYDALCSIWGLKSGKSDDRAYYACKGTVPSECEKISAAVKRTFFPGGEAIYQNSKCVIKVHETAQSSRYQINSKAVTIDKLKTINGIDPAHFYSKDLQVNASSDLYKHIQKYIFNELKLSVAPMQCFSGIVDNVLVIPMSAEEEASQRQKQNQCVAQNNSAMSGSMWGGGGAGAQDCMKKYPIPEQMSDILTCEYNGDQFDLMFKKLDVKWDKKSIGGYQGLTCLTAGGEFTGKNCTLASKAQCDAVNAEFKKQYPNAKGMEWDPNIGNGGACVLKDAKEVHTIRKVAETAGFVAVTLVSAVAGGPIVWALTAVEATALVTEAVTAGKLSDWAEGFIVDAARCNDSACADRVLKNHIARVIYGSRQFNDTQNKAIATQMQRLLELLDEDILDKMVDAGISGGYIGENRNPDLEKSLRKYYNTKLTNGERALLGTNYASTVLTFATVIGAGVTAGLRQAFKRNWIHISEARQAKWLKYKILKPDDVAGLGGTGARGAIDDIASGANKTLKQELADIGVVESSVYQDVKTGKMISKDEVLKRIDAMPRSGKNKSLKQELADIGVVERSVYRDAETGKILSQEEVLKRIDNMSSGAAGPRTVETGTKPKTDAPEPKPAEPKAEPTAAPKTEPVTPTGAPVTPQSRVYEKLGDKVKADIADIKSGKAKELNIPRGQLTDDEWKILKDDLAKDGLEITDGNMYNIVKKSGKATPKAIPKTRSIEEIENSLGDRYKNLKPELRTNPERTLVFPKNSLTSAEWETLNKSLAKDNLEVVPSGNVMFMRQKRIYPDAISDIRSRVYSEFNTHADNIKKGVERELHIPKEHLSDEEWKVLEADLNKEGLEITEANSHYYTVRKAQTSGNVPTVPRTIPKVDNSIDALKTKVSSNFDNYLQSCASGGACNGLPVNRLTKEEWQQLNQYAKSRGVELYETQMFNKNTGTYDDVMRFRPLNSTNDVVGGAAPKTTPTTNPGSTPKAPAPVVPKRTRAQEEAQWRSLYEKYAPENQTFDNFKKSFGNNLTEAEEYAKNWDLNVAETLNFTEARNTSDKLWTDFNNKYGTPGDKYPYGKYADIRAQGISADEYLEIRKKGISTDEYLADKLGWSKEQIEDANKVYMAQQDVKIAQNSKLPVGKGDAYSTFDSDIAALRKELQSNLSSAAYADIEPFLNKGNLTLEEYNNLVDYVSHRKYDEQMLISAFNKEPELNTVAPRAYDNYNTKVLEARSENVRKIDNTAGLSRKNLLGEQVAKNKFVQDFVSKRVTLYEDIITKNPSIYNRAKRWNQLSIEEREKLCKEIFEIADNKLMVQHSDFGVRDLVKDFGEPETTRALQNNGDVYLSKQHFSDMSFKEVMSTIAHEQAHKVDRLNPNRGILGSQLADLGRNEGYVQGYAGHSYEDYRKELTEQSSWLIDDAMGKALSKLGL